MRYGFREKRKGAYRRKSIYVKWLWGGRIPPEVANYINAKLDEFNSIDDYKRISADLKATLLELNIADDYFKAKTQVESLESDLEIRDKEIYNLKHDLISAQLKTETLEETISKLERENKELLLQKTKLEASLEDALLGSVSDV